MSPEARRLFRTVMFTDIVGSTELAAEIGDARWRRTVAAHNGIVRRELKRHGGREIDTAGDGFFVIFENPTDAVRCAAAIVPAVHEAGVRVRAGIHTGEVEPAGRKFGGIAVHTAARLLAFANPDEIVVSSTVRDLVAGSSHAFEDRGTQALKGLPGDWHLYSLSLPRDDAGYVARGVADGPGPGRRVSRRTVAAALVSIVALAVGAVVLAVGFLRQPPVAPATGPNAVVGYDLAGPSAFAGFRSGRGPAALALGDGELWLANVDSGTVSRVDPRSGVVSTLGQSGAHPSAITVGGGRVYVADRYSDLLTILDAREGGLTAQVNAHARALAVGGGRLWLADDLTDALVGHDSLTGDQVARVDLPEGSGPSAIALSGSTIWVAAPRVSELLRGDVSQAQVSLTPLSVDVQPVTTVEALNDDVWIASAATDVIARIETSTGRIAVRASVCDHPIALAPTPGGVWVACSNDRSLWHVDRSGAVLLRIELDGVPSDVVADGERAWVTLRVD